MSFCAGVVTESRMEPVRKAGSQITALVLAAIMSPGVQAASWRAAFAWQPELLVGLAQLGGGGGGGGLTATRLAQAIERTEAARRKANRKRRQGPPRGR